MKKSLKEGIDQQGRCPRASGGAAEATTCGEDARHPFQGTEAAIS
jgi:hypothetical protein